MSHKSRCCDKCGGYLDDIELCVCSPKIEKPLSALAAIAVDLGDPKASTNFRKSIEDIIRDRIESLRVEDLYVIARAAQQTGYPMMQWPSILRDSLKSFLCNNNKVHRKCKMSSNGKQCALPVLHDGDCQY